MSFYLYDTIEKGRILYDHKKGVCNYSKIHYTPKKRVQAIFFIYMYLIHQKMVKVSFIYLPYTPKENG